MSNDVKICDACGALVHRKGESLHRQFHKDFENIIAVLAQHADELSASRRESSTSNCQVDG